MTSEIEHYIAANCLWEKLPFNVQNLFGGTQKEYEKQVVEYSIKTQQHYLGNLVQLIVPDQKTYYKDLIGYSRSHLMMFPYHLSEYVVRGLRITPFQYYIDILSDIMIAEKSYDSLPNFTAADCLRLLGIGRNQYIDLMNQCRSTRKLFRRKNVRELLPSLPKDITIEPWWILKPGHIMEDDIKNLVKDTEKKIIDSLLESGSCKTGFLEKETVHKLYSRGLVYLEVPLEDNDCLCVPPLEGFVMNRVLGDYLENLMYKIFVSIDEHTCVTELAKVLQIDLGLVKVALSLFCRLGFAQRKANVDADQFSNVEPDHPSWLVSKSLKVKIPTTSNDDLLSEIESTLAEGICDIGLSTPNGEFGRTPIDESLGIFGIPSLGIQHKRIAFLYDSTLTAFLMMGNLSPGLKSHAVTMFEVGKMLDEGLDSLVAELGKIQRSDSEGEAQRYFEHALTLKTTIGFLRNNPNLIIGNESGNLTDLYDLPPALDLIRWESLSNLDPATTSRLLSKNYQFLVSMAPLSYEISRVEGEMPPHFGPPIPEINSVWFKLFLYNLTGSGPPSLLLPKGERLHRLPSLFTQYEKVLVTPWGHDPTVIPLTAVFFTVNEALMHSPVFIQAYGWYHDVCVQHIPLPIDKNSPWVNHKALKSMNESLDFKHTFGFVKMVSFLHVSLDSEGDACSSLLGTSEIKTGVPRSFPSDIGIVRIPQVISFDDVSTIENMDQEVSLGESMRKDALPSNVQLLPPLDQWMLLECHFGLPLFDANLNDEISRRVVSHNLFAPKSVEKFISSSKDLVGKLEKFLLQWEAQRNPFVSADRRQLNDNSSSLPLPTKPLLFGNEKLVIWNGS